MNFAVLVTQLPASTREHEQLVRFGESLLPLPEGVFQPAPNVLARCPRRSGGVRTRSQSLSGESRVSHQVLLKRYGSRAGQLGSRAASAQAVAGVCSWRPLRLGSSASWVDVASQLLSPNYALKRTCAEQVSDAINRRGRAGRLA